MTRTLAGTPAADGLRMPGEFEPHAGCWKFRARLGDEALRWVNAAHNRSRRLRGLFARIIEAGVVSVGDRARRAD